MFEISSKKVDFEKDNTLIKRNINLDENLDCFVLISSSNANLWDLIINKILDSVVDKIWLENTYNDFSIALENVNAFIKTWKEDSDEKIKLSIVVAILNHNHYIFSNIWKSSCYLINGNNEIVELTEKDENKKEFNYVSSWELKNNEIIVSSTKRLLNYLSKSDLLDGLILSEDINIFNKNIKNILQNELLKENVLVSSLKYVSNNAKEEANRLDTFKQSLIKSLDNKFSKNLIGRVLALWEKINASSKLLKNILLVSGIVIWIVVLYSILSTVVWITTQNEQKEEAKQNVVKAKTYLRLASENIASADIFETNIKNAENIIAEIQDDELFLSDVSKINDDINILKKQFNKVEVFEYWVENTIFNEGFIDPVKIIKNNLKPYVITEKWVVWPILPNTKVKNYTFNSLEENETFIDATFIGDNMYLLTSLSKVVRFTKNWYFNYMDVSGQKTWEKANEINSYSNNIYLLGEEDNQIYKHALYGNTFKAGQDYLKEDDLTQIWDIRSIAIDGWFYILKKDLSIIKFFSNPYRIEKIIINKLPKNYDIEDDNGIIDLKNRADLNYVYLLMNNKIWIFQPNTTNHLSTKSLTYIWQIEWDSKQIKDFFVNHDGEIMILNEKWLFKITFEVSDGRLLIR